MRAMPDLAKIKFLVDHGARVNAATSRGSTPLLIAAGLPAAEEVVRYLIQKGADIKAMTSLDAFIHAGSNVMKTLWRSTPNG